MGCYFCKNYKGLHNFCEDDFHYVETGNESLDCKNYEYNGELKYYSYLSQRDELEVKEILGRVIGYFMKIGFDDMSVATQRLSFSIFESVNTITNLEECLNEAK